jgi:hypothetical protein
MINRPNMMGMLADLVKNAVLSLTATGAPTSGTSGTGVGIAGYGSTYTNRTNGDIYVQVGAITSPSWQLLNLNSITGDVTIGATGVSAIGAGKVTSAMMDASLVRVATGSISAANIIGTSAGQLGHASGVEMVPAGGAHVVNEFISAIIIVDFATAAYTGGGNTGVKIGGGGAALSGIVANTVIIQAAADCITYFNPLAATALVLSENTGINFVTASAPTNPGTAAGVIRWKCAYRQYATGL